MAAGERRAFGGAVAVDEARRFQLAQRAADMRHGERVAAGEELPQRPQIVDALIDHHVEKAGGEPERGDAVFADGAADFLEGRRAGRHHGQPAAVEERAPDFEGGGVERNRRELEKSFVGRKGGVAGLFHQPHDAAMRHGDALRGASRAGGEQDVGEAAGR